MANPSHVKIFSKGAKAWNDWREKNRSIIPDLSGFKSASYGKGGSGITLDRIFQLHLGMAVIKGGKELITRDTIYQMQFLTV
jgi:hypothetical protein